MNQRELEVNIKVTENEFYVLVEDSESGEHMHLGPYDYSDQERGRFDKELGDEIYSWISIAREGIDRFNGVDDDDDDDEEDSEG